MLDRSGRSYLSEHLLLRDVTAPRPFDRSIAHVELATSTNNLSEGMDVSVAAFFGSEVVSLATDDGGALEVDSSIFKSEISLSLFNCSSLVIDPSAQNRIAGIAQKTKALRTSLAKTDNQKSFVLDAGASAAQLNAKAGAVLDSTWQNNTEQLIERKSEHSTSQVEIGVEHIKIEGNSDGTPLLGKLVNLPKCWRVEPIDKSEPYAALVQIQVRKNWIELKQPRVSGPKTALGVLVGKIWKPSGRIHDFHRSAFNALLMRLVEKGLQSATDRNYAVLASHSLVAVPSRDPLSSKIKNGSTTERVVTLPADLLSKVLTQTPLRVVDLLIEQGVSEDVVEAIYEPLREISLTQIAKEGRRVSLTESAKAFAHWFRVNW